MENRITNQTTSVLQESLCRTPAVTSTTDGKGNAQVSVYCDKIATHTEIGTAIAKIVAAYPSIFNRMSDQEFKEYTIVMKESIKYSKLSGQQLYDATMNCICTKKQEYQFNISDLTDYDVKARLYCYSWACDKQGFVRSNLKRTDCTPWEYWWCMAKDLDKVNRLAEILNKD